MPKSESPFTLRMIFYKYDVGENEVKAEYEVLHSEVINNGFWIPDTSWLDDELYHMDYEGIDVFDELPFDQVHEVMANVTPWASQDSWSGEWDGGLDWNSVATRRLTGENLKEFLICHPRCNRLHGLKDEYEFNNETGVGPTILQHLKWCEAVDALPSELRELTEEQRRAMIKFYSDALYQYYEIGEDR